jgi:hypothetical protein
MTTIDWRRIVGITLTFWLVYYGAFLPGCVEKAETVWDQSSDICKELLRGTATSARACR